MSKLAQAHADCKRLQWARVWPLDHCKDLTICEERSREADGAKRCGGQPITFGTGASYQAPLLNWKGQPWFSAGSEAHKEITDAAADAFKRAMTRVGWLTKQMAEKKRWRNEPLDFPRCQIWWRGSSSHRWKGERRQVAREKMGDGTGRDWARTLTKQLGGCR